MKKLLICLSLPFLVGCSMMNDWSKTDKVLFGSYAALQVADALQTRDIISSDAYVEKNPIIRNHFDSQDKVVVYFIGATAITAVVADVLPDKARTIFLGVMAGNEAITVINNNAIGVRFKF